MLLVNVFVIHCLNTCLQARAGIEELHFLPFNPANRRTAITYRDGEGRMHRVSKGAPEEVIRFAFNFAIIITALPLIYQFCFAEALLSNFLLVQILDMVHNKSEIKNRVHSFIDKFAERGLRSLGLAYQVRHSLLTIFSETVCNCFR